MGINKKTILFLVLAVVLVVGAIYGGGRLGSYIKYSQLIDDIVIEAVDLTQVPDGVYFGQYDASLVAAEVTITVVNHRITAIDLDHKHDQGEAAEEIINRVLSGQTLQVDLVTGATNSSKVILKAIEAALLSACRR